MQCNAGVLLTSSDSGLNASPNMPIGTDFSYPSLKKTSNKNVLRGLHYQIEPMGQGKLITVISGKILDVAVDIRKNSETFAQHIMNELSSKGLDSIWIPPGFAHGFLSLENDSTVVNRCTREFSPDHERGIRWDDPFFNIPWPRKNPTLSEKDKGWKLRKEG